MLDSLAVIIEEPKRVAVRRIALDAPGAGDVVVEIDYSGVSSGTEKLIWSGAMPQFPGMGYPLVPGYEAVGRIVAAGAEASLRVGEHVFVPGARCFGAVRGLFGANAKHLVVGADRVVTVAPDLGDRGALIALAATAQHALAVAGGAPELIIGHGVLGRLIARLAVIAGGAPTVWETNPNRMDAGDGYRVCHAGDDARRDYQRVIDVSGDAAVLDALIARLAPQGLITLAGFYAAPMQFSFAPAFMREARIAIAAQWQKADLVHVTDLIASRRLDLDGLITHRVPAHEAGGAYHTAFGTDNCLKLLIDWRDAS
ncbi:chlorophyll synthesis pathway protein BchC [Acidiphilium sp. PA]|uniref:chlorophyll synthesis pathway protein BchC n=1 Tax=Acidiphilium sp. PA TaxID=2871705 RepID=UPI0022430B8D|nr:chlorophyll synthesis pathway protein BchC [Acidiphilium sp. PA]MCW8306975.1 chlorophyll synthesis pathway protein BchC [Acidiphilium sp. PA]